MSDHQKKRIADMNRACREFAMAVTPVAQRATAAIKEFGDIMAKYGAYAAEKMARRR
jgi:hypothetical protein